ncbi:hypothetical protein TNIN_19301 [Trichonephila inaurata madagascariensis]|uniref:Uncharacterized protein n=1 Tax=Trichonephila inaurata madagascariensis TaxID=2747483 RepID=A0A8X6XLK7_9ARAC|nr:hypothetical protein TNIN_19301 [Trichonephila inaurata madagascariensis]
MFARILRFYFFGRRLEASDLPVDPDEALSDTSYMRILAFQAPEDDSTDQESEEDGTEPENDDFFLICLRLIFVVSTWMYEDAEF